MSNTPIFDEWQRCPRCKGRKTLLRFWKPDMGQPEVWFDCMECGLRSETKSGGREMLDLDKLGMEQPGDL